MLEQIYGPKLIERKALYAFVMGVSYSILGIFSGLLLFRSDPAFPAVAFTSLLLLPSINKMLRIEELQSEKLRKFSILNILKNHNDIFRVYFFIFLGIMLTFSFFSLALPSIATSSMFKDQINVVGLGGRSLDYSFLDFTEIFYNNFTVLAFFLLASLFYGAGSVFLLVWNASVWGTIFGIFARDATAVSGSNPVIYFCITLLAVFPHLITEASAYFLASISGGIISKATIHDKVFSKNFNRILKNALVIFTLAAIALVIGAFVEVYITKNIFQIFKL